VSQNRNKVACQSGRGEHHAGTESKTLLLDRRLSARAGHCDRRYQKKPNERRIFKKKASTVTCVTETKEELQQIVKNRTRPKKESWASKQI
jgi:hypothetical protein